MGDRAEGEPAWHVARRCDNGACVEIGTLGESVLVRSSADPDGECVTLSRSEWQVFAAGLKTATSTTSDLPGQRLFYGMGSPSAGLGAVAG
jgi:hypothetical protein